MELLKVHTLEAGREKLVHAMEGKGTKSIRLELLNSLDYILAQDILAGSQFQLIAVPWLMDML